jgi:tetratricopeptide (TPR) repeat protein
MLECYDKMIKNGLYVLHDYLHETSFNNVIIVAVSLKKYDWAEKFLAMFKSKLHPKISESVVNLNLARIHMAKKNYTYTLSCLEKINIRYPFYFMHSKVLLAHIYFEQKEFDLIDSVLDTLSKYIKRNKKISKDYSEHIEIFIRFMNKLNKSVGNDFKLHELKLEIEKASFLVISKQWMLDEIENMLAFKKMSPEFSKFIN